MAKLSKTSLSKLNECRQDLIEVILKTERICPDDFDFTVLEGHRSVKQQEENVRKGVSQTMNSKHCKTPSEAVDIAPYPIDWKDTERFKKLADYVKRAAKELNCAIVWGGDWKSLIDMPHFEIKG